MRDVAANAAHRPATAVFRAGSFSYFSSRKLDSTLNDDFENVLVRIGHHSGTMLVTPRKIERLSDLRVIRGLSLRFGVELCKLQRRL
jgi:hypothetical protein